MSAEDRREQVIRAAVTEFSIRGLEGTSTGDIAKRVGVSQPYLFRLFPSKKALFIAACNRGADQVVAAFEGAAEGKYGSAALDEMGAAYAELLDEDREVLMMQLQQFAACHDEEIQEAVSLCMQRIWAVVANLTGAPDDVCLEFFARGMFCNTIAAMRGGRESDSRWDAVIGLMKTMPMPTFGAAVGG